VVTIFNPQLASGSEDRCKGCVTNLEFPPLYFSFIMTALGKLWSNDL